MSSNTKAEKKAPTYQKVNVPDFTDAEDPCNTPPFFEACYYIAIMMLQHQWTQYLSLDEIWVICDQTWESDTDTNKPVKEEHEEVYDILNKVDPTLFCWYNYFTLFLIQEDKQRVTSAWQLTE